jgi:hypothetical protein
MISCSSMVVTVALTKDNRYSLNLRKRGVGGIDVGKAEIHLNYPIVDIKMLYIFNYT